MTSKLSYDYVKNFIESEGYQLLSDSYKNAHEKLLLKCPIGHEHKIKFNNFQQGQRCGKCEKIVYKHSYDYVKSFVESKGYTLLSNSYKNAHSKLSLLCKNNHKIEKSFANIHSNKGCPYCSGKKRYYEDEKLFIESEGYQLLSDTIKGSLNFICPNGHKFHTTLWNFKNNQRCKKCNTEKLKKDYSDVKNFIESEGYQLLSDTYINNKEKLLVKCPIGHEYKTSFSNFLNGKRCFSCWSNKLSSKAETQIYNIINSMIPNSIIRNDRTQLLNPLTGKNLELDIWIPDLGKAIEYNGEYWHSDDYSREKDRIKKEQCEELGIDLLVIEEGKWLNNQETEIKIIEKWLL